MNNNLTFHRSLTASFQSKVDLNYWDKVLEFFEQKNYTETIRAIIRYLDSSIETKFANPSKTSYSIPHGSIIVNIEITDVLLRIQAPFLTITGSKLVPLLRQTAQLNFAPMTLAQIQLENEQLYYKYECPLNLCEPLKIYDVLREICINADNYDDEFITKFNAVRLREPQIVGYDTEKQNKAWDLTQQYIQEALTAYEQLDNKRLTQFLWDVLIITLLKIDFICAPQGYLRTEMEKTISYLNSKDDYYQRLNSGKEFLKRLQTMPKETFTRDLYSIDIFVPYKYFTNLDGVRNSLKYAHETSSGEMKANDPLGATLTLEYGILNLFYNNNLDDKIATILMTTLEKSSAKPLNESSKILYDAVNGIMTDASLATVTAPVSIQQKNNGNNKGFFGKLFGL